MKTRLYLFLLIFLFAGCTTSKNSGFLDCGVSQNHQNNETTIKKIDEVFKIHLSIVVLVQNNTNGKISANRDFDIKIYQFDEELNEWVQIENSGNDHGEVDKYITIRYLGFAPKIPLNEDKAEIFICLYGKNESTNEIVAASSFFSLR